MADALGDIATELYALSLDEFTKARNERAADARGSGDGKLADRITQLKKPSTSAWAVNMLARHRTEEVRQLLELGASLRAAQGELDADELRELGKQRQKLIAAVVKQARILAEELGGPIGSAAADEVGRTLQAALVDEEAADAVMTGRLAKPLAASGWGSVDVDSAVAVSTRKRAVVTKISDKHLAKAKRRVEGAEAALRKRQAEAEELCDAIDALAPRQESLISELEELKERITELHKQLAAVDKEWASLERQREEALAVVNEAEANLDDAVAEVNRLS